MSEWDALINRCITNGRDDLLNQLRGILSGQSAAEPQPTELEQVEAWFTACMMHWQHLSVTYGGATRHRTWRTVAFSGLQSIECRYARVDRASNSPIRGARPR